MLNDSSFSFFSDKPFTILAPKNTADTRDVATLLRQPELVKKLLLDHVVLGSRLDLTNITSETSFKTLRGRLVNIRPTDKGLLQANDAIILQRKVEVPNGILMILDNYLFADEQMMKRNASSQENINVENLSVFNAEEPISSKTSFIENVQQVLSFLKSGVRVFQHFLVRSNVSKLLEDGGC